MMLPLFLNEINFLQSTFDASGDSIFLFDESAIDLVSFAIENRSIASINQALSTYIGESRELAEFASAVCRDLHCFRPSAFIILKKALSQLSRRLSTCISKGVLTMAMIGDSIGVGCCDSRGGFGAGILAGLQNLLGVDVECKLRNRSRGATKPEYFYYCDFPDGDEDVVVLEFVPHAGNNFILYLEGLVRKMSLLPNKPTLILVATSPPGHLTKPTMVESTSYYRAIATRYSIIFLDLTVAIIHGLKPCSQKSFVNISFYGDKIHPNEYGHLYASCQILAIFESALKFLPVDDVNKGLPKAVEPVIAEVKTLGYTACYSVIEEDKSRWPLVIDINNFQIVQRRQAGSTFIHKRCWQGNYAGDYITFFLPPFVSLKVSVYMGPSDDFGITEVRAGNEIISILDTKRKPSDNPLLEAHRGYIKEFHLLKRNASIIYDQGSVSFTTQTNSNISESDGPHLQIIQIIALLVETSVLYKYD